MPARGRRRWLVGLPVTFATWMLLATFALAAFTSAVTAAGDVSTGVLGPPTGLSASAGSCESAQHDSIVLTWTATASAWAEGYEVLRSTDGTTYAVVATLAGAATESYTDSSLSFSTTYWYRVRALKHAWTSEAAEASRTTRGAQCLL